VVGVLWHAADEREEAPFLGQLRLGLQELGYVEGRSITLVNTYASERYERFALNARSLVEQRVDVIVAITRPAALAAQQATRTIPIVAVAVSDPVGSGLVSSLARPGGNITGLGNWAVDLAAKRVELLKEAVKGLTRVALLVNPGDPGLAKTFVRESTAAADRLGLSIQAIEATRVEEIEAGFSAISPSERTGVIVNNDPFLLMQAERIARLAQARGMPSMGFARSMCKQGMLLAYGPDNLPSFAALRRTSTRFSKALDPPTCPSSSRPNIDSSSTRELRRRWATPSLPPC
jgi:putative ABC transport system substrate-binding protein